MGNQRIQSNAFWGMVAIAIILGSFLRFYQLDHKVYWLDEVYSTTRIASFSIAEIRQSLFQNQIISSGELQQYQQPKPDSTIVDTIQILIEEDAKHPPFYYILANLWMHRFGSAIATLRALSAWISVLALPLMFALAWELFFSPIMASLATVLIALSPFDILFAQTVRQYSLLTVIILGSSWLLLRANRLGKWRNWGSYSLFCAVGLYTHLFFSLTLLAHSGFMIGQFIADFTASKPIHWKSHPLGRYLLAIAAVILLYSPWIFAMMKGGDRGFQSSGWVQSSTEFSYLLRFWILSFTSLFFDLEMGFNHLGTYLLRAPFVLLIAIVLYEVFRHTSNTVRGFIFTSVWVPFLVLALPDLVGGGQRSAVTRYLICSFPGIQLAVAYWLGRYLLRWRIAQGIWALLLTASLSSILVSAYSETWWSKGVSYFNAEIADVLNRLETPLVISDRGNNYLNQGNLISLSYRLDDDVQLLLMDYDSLDIAIAEMSRPRTPNLVAYFPSDKLRNAIAMHWGMLVPIEPPELGLWRIAPPSRHASEMDSLHPVRD